MKLLWLGQEAGLQAQRLDTLLACFDLSFSREELQVVESPFQALCCLLTYLFVQVTSFPVEAAAVTRRLSWGVVLWDVAVGWSPAPSPPSVCAVNASPSQCSDSSEGSGGRAFAKPRLLPDLEVGPAPKCDRGLRRLTRAGTLLHFAHACRAFWALDCSRVPMWVVVPVGGVSCNGEKIQRCSPADLARVTALPW